MVAVVGRVKPGHLAELQRRGFAPGAAVEAIKCEARRRHPHAGTILIEPAGGGRGFEILAL